MWEDVEQAAHGLHPQGSKGVHGARTVTAQPLSSGLSTEGPHCCTEAVNSRKLPASRHHGWGREAHPPVSLALGADVSASGTALKKKVQTKVCLLTIKEQSVRALQGRLRGCSALGRQKPL